MEQQQYQQQVSPHQIEELLKLLEAMYTHNNNPERLLQNGYYNLVNENNKPIPQIIGYEDFVKIQSLIIKLLIR